MARARASYQDMFLGALDNIGQAGRTIAANRQTKVENAQNAQRLDLAKSQNQREQDKFNLEKPGLELEQKAKANDYKKQVERDLLQKAYSDSQGQLEAVRDIPLGVRNDKTEEALSQKVADQYDRLGDKPVGTTWRALQENASKEKQTAETHASQLKNDEANRQKGSFAGLGVTPEGNALILDSRRGKVIDTGVEKYVPPKLGGNQRDVVKPGGELIPGLTPIDGVQITKDSVSKTKAAYAGYQAFKKQLDEYEDLVSKQGAELAGENADRADALVTDLGMKLKALQDLGVLNGKDWQLMMKQIPSSTGILASLKSGAYQAVGQDAFGPRLDVLSGSMDDKFKTFAETNGFKKKGAQQNTAILERAKQALSDPEATAEDKKAAQSLIDRLGQ